MRKRKSLLTKLGLVGTVAVAILIARNQPTQQKYSKDTINNAKESIVQPEQPISILGRREESIEIPGAIYEKVISDIDYILEHGHAEKINRTDFNHFHILIPRERLPLYPNLNKNEMISDPYIKILYHTRESSNVGEYGDRNLVSTLKTKPRVITPEETLIERTDDGFFIFKPKPPHYNGHTIYPKNLNCRDITTIDFKVDPKGKYELKDGRKIKFDK